MIADPLTKVMSAEVLNKTLMSGIFDMQPTVESTIIKEKNRESRRKVRDAKRSATRTVGHEDREEAEFGQCSVPSDT